MNNLVLNAFNLNRERQVYFFAILTSLLLSILIGYRDSVINPDGICYLMSAQMLNIAPIKDVMQFCPQAKWPFYSILIYAVQQISHLSYGVSAQLINGLFTLVSVIVFIRIVETLGANQRILWLAALVILFDHQFNVLRDNIIRDHGFWAFYLLSVYFLLLWYRQPKWTMAILWNASLLAATLFRIEGAIFLLAMPLIAFCQLKQPFFARLNHYFMLNIFLVLFLAVFGLWQFIYPEQSLKQLSRVNEVYYQMQSGIMIMVDRYQSVRAALIANILPGEAAPDASAIVLLVWIGWYLYNVLLTLGTGYALLILYAWKTQAAKFSSPVIYGYIIVNIVLTLGFMAENLFISKRYLVALILLLMIYIPFAINDLLEKWPSIRHRAFLVIMAIVFFVSALSGVVEFGRSKFYIRTAGDWVASSIPQHAKLYENDLQLMYYSKYFGMKIFETYPVYLQVEKLKNGKWKEFDYLVLRLRDTEELPMQALLAELKNLTPMKIFSDRRGNSVTVYKIKIGENK